MNRNRIALVCLLALVGMGGCSFEEPYLGVSCPGAAVRGNAASLDYIMLDDDHTCQKDSCISADNCCGLSGNEAKNAFEAFSRNKCPAETAFSFCHQDLQGSWYCGGDSLDCKTGYHAKDKQCIPDTDTACGKDETDCTQIEGTSCVDGVCAGSCEDGQSWCVDTCYDFTALHINSCASGMNFCMTRFANWDDNKTNGCEVDLEAIHVKSYTIMIEDGGPDKTIHITCNTGYANWDSDITNGCETKLADVHVESWNADDDTISCEDGFADCNGKHSAVVMEQNPSGEMVVATPADGCEASMNSAETCGTCEKHCESNEICFNRSCDINTCTSDELPDTCLANVSGDLQKVCVNTKTDVNNCGLCGNVCSDNSIANASSGSCSNGECQYTCNDGYTQCGGNTVSDIVCIPNESLLSDKNNCGGCGNPETGEHICQNSESCVGGTCQANTCGEEMELCGLGVCRNVHGEDADNCGLCNYKCADHPLLNATSSTCLNGACQYTCSAGYKNCGGSDLATVNCVNTATDPKHCGNCTTSCAAGKVCVNSNCVSRCGDGFTNCDGTCVDVRSNNSHCGQCRKSCDKGLSCNSGRCVKTTIDLLVDSNSKPDVICELPSNVLCTDIAQVSSGFSLEYCIIPPRFGFDFETGTNVEISDADITVNNDYFSPGSGTLYYKVDEKVNLSKEFDRILSTSCPTKSSLYTTSTKLEIGYLAGLKDCGSMTIYCAMTEEGNFYAFSILGKGTNKFIAWNPARSFKFTE